ncbi:hypothetical protein [Fusibacter sp. JL216-2]|uniref:hypothetical protein n=1 Tax=Fusibacter sp. JL216-2 TaxID=3071453 RepID=UPI003D3510D1
MSFSSRIAELDIDVSENGQVDIQASALVNTYNLETSDYDYTVEVASQAAITIKNITLDSVEESGKTDKDGKYSTSLGEGVYEVSIAMKDSSGNPTLVVDREKIVIDKPYAKILEDIKEEHFNYSPRDNYNLQGALHATGDLKYTQAQRTEMYFDFSEKEISMAGDYLKAFSELYSAGIDPTDLDGRNLLSEMESKSVEALTGGLINQAASLLQAINTHDITLSDDAVFNETEVINMILQAQGPNGGWSWDGKGEGLDTSGDVLMALAPYYDSKAEVKTAIDKFVDWVSSIQTSNGHIADPSWGPSVASTSKVICGLVAIGVDPQGPSFTKDGNTLIDQLKYFYDEELNGYKGYSGNLDLSFNTPQAVAALSVYNTFEKTKSPVLLIDFSDVELETVQNIERDYSVNVSYSVGKKTDAKALENGKDLAAHVTIRSLVDRTENVLLVVALYDNKNTLINYSYMSQEMSESDEKVFHAGFKLPSVLKGHYVKCYVWEGTSLTEPGKVLSQSSQLK